MLGRISINDECVKTHSSKENGFLHDAGGGSSGDVMNLEIM